MSKPPQMKPMVGVHLRDRTPAESKNNGGTVDDQYRHAGYIAGQHEYCIQCGHKHPNKSPHDTEMELCDSCKGQVTSGRR